MTNYLDRQGRSTNIIDGAGSRFLTPLAAEKQTPKSLLNAESALNYPPSPPDRKTYPGDTRDSFEVPKKWPHVLKKPLPGWQKPEWPAFEEPGPNLFLQLNQLTTQRALLNAAGHFAGGFGDFAVAGEVIKQLQVVQVNHTSIRKGDWYQKMRDTTKNSTPWWILAQAGAWRTAGWLKSQLMGVFSNGPGAIFIGVSTIFIEL